MAETTMPADGTPAGQVREATAWRYGIAGAVLIALAFVVPFVGQFVSPGLARAFTRQGADSMMLLPFLGVLAWLFTRNRSGLAQARGLFAVGVLLCVAVAASVVHFSRERAQLTDHLRAALDFDYKTRPALDDATQALNDIPLNPYLAPEALASVETMAQAQARLQTYRAAVQRHQQALAAFHDEWQAFIDSAPRGEFRHRIQASWGAELQAERQRDADMGAAELARADAMRALFDWAQAARPSQRDSQLQFTAPQQRAQWLALSARVQEANAHLTELGAAARAEEARAAAIHEQWRQRSEDLLARQPEK